MELDKVRFLADFHQTMEKDLKKAWHDQHINHKLRGKGGQVPLYDKKYQKHPRKL
jgi:hypothetical protein